MNLKLFREIKKDYYLMAISVFLMKTGQFMSLPFLAIYLYKYLSPANIGLVIGLGALVYGFFGVAAGLIADKMGIKKSLILALIISGIALLLFFKISALWWYLFMSVVFGIGRSIFNVSSKAYGASYGAPIRRLCFSLRNMMVDAAAAIGPLLGAGFAIKKSAGIFAIIGILYFTLALISTITLKEANTIRKPAPFSHSIFILLKDHNLQLLMFIFFVYWIAFSQIDSILPLYLADQLKNGIHLYTLFLVIEAVGCVSLQLLFTYVTRNISDYPLAIFGMIFFAVAYAIIGLYLNTSMLIIAAIFTVFAQIIILPLNDLLTSKLAHPDKMATYYGAITLSAAGMGVGPMLGGFIYQHFNATTLFLVMTAGCCLTIPVYYLLTTRISTQTSEKNRA